MRDMRVREFQIIVPVNRERVLNSIKTFLIPLVPLSGVLILWLISLPKINLAQMGDIGLISVLPVTYYAALAILAVSYMLALHKHQPSDFILLLHILLLIFILHGTPQIVYVTLRYSWAWKHVGIVDYIQRNGSVNPLINNLNAYHNWPGFFALAAFYNQVAGLASALSYAGWGPVFFNLLDLGALLMIFKNLTTDRRHVWLSVFLFYLFSWVGQDYFSPQAFTYFLYLVSYAILLRWFIVRKIDFRERTQTILHNSWLTNLYNTIVRRAIQDREQVIHTSPRQRIYIMASLVMLFFVVASSHQLTPLMMISGLTILVLFQMTNQRFLPILMAVVTVVWIIFMAVGFLDGNLAWVVKSFGSFFQNINGNLLNLTTASAGQQFIAKVDRALSLFVWILGLLGLYRRYRVGHWDLIPALLAAAPLPMLVLNAYGGEMLFRVYLFSLPFITFLAAGLFYPSLDKGTTAKTPLFALFLSLLLIPGFLFGYYGKDSMYYFSPKEVAAAQYVFSIAPKGSLIVDGTWDWPRQYTNYEYYNYVSIAGFSRSEMLKIIQNPINELTKIMDDATPGSVYISSTQPANKAQEKPGAIGPRDADDYPDAYIVITRSQIAEAKMTGILPVDWLSNLAQTISTSNNFRVVYSNPDAVVIEYVHISEPGK